MLNQSDVYQNNKDSKGLTVILHSCRAGRSYVDENGNYQPSYGETQSEAYPDYTIIAPDERDAFSSDGKELGPRKLDDSKNKRGDYRDGAEHRVGKQLGNWNVFKGGRFIGSYRGEDYKAETAPSWYERTFKFIPNPNVNSGNNSNGTTPTNESKEKYKN